MRHTVRELEFRIKDIVGATYYQSRLTKQWILNLQIQAEIYDTPFLLGPILLGRARWGLRRDTHTCKFAFDQRADCCYHVDLITKKKAFLQQKEDHDAILLEKEFHENLYKSE